MLWRNQMNFNNMSYMACRDPRAWNQSVERQTRYLIDSIKYEDPKYQCKINLEEAIKSLPFVKPRQDDFRKPPCIRKRPKRPQKRYKKKTVELRPDDSHIGFDKETKNKENYEKSKGDSHRSHYDGYRVRPARAKMHLPGGDGFFRKSSEERMNDTINDVGNLINNTINAMIAVLNAYMGTAQNLFGKHQSLKQKRSLIEKRMTPSQDFEGRDHSDALAYIDFAIDDIVKRLWTLYEMMDVSELPKAADQLFDLIEYFMEVEQVYSEVVPPKHGSFDEEDHQSDSECEGFGAKDIDFTDNDGCDSLSPRASDNFVPLNNFEDYEHYKYVSDRKNFNIKDNLQYPLNALAKDTKVNMKNCQNTLKDIRLMLNKVLCSLAAKPFLTPLPMPTLSQAAPKEQLREHKLSEDLARINDLNNEILIECKSIDEFVKFVLNFNESKRSSKWPCRRDNT